MYGCARAFLLLSPYWHIPASCSNYLTIFIVQGAYPVDSNKVFLFCILVLAGILKEPPKKIRNWLFPRLLKPDCTREKEHKDKKNDIKNVSV